MKLFIWVQHLWGKGHVRRMARIAAACATGGIEVTVAAGGPGGRQAFLSHPDIHAHQLPALRTRDAQYTELVTEGGDTPEETFWALRHDVLTHTIESAAPDVVLIELFPFGRRKFGPEVLDLIAHARALASRPLILSSVRDVVEVKAPEKTAQMEGWLRDHFDGALVHGDEAFLPLTETAPWASAVPLHYTGYVTEGITPKEKRGVVVSAGSSPSGAALLKAAAEAGRDAGEPWHIFVPPDVPAPRGGGAVTIHAFSPLFTDFLSRAEVSISEAGYNTFAETLAAGAKPVLVPYAAADQTEQPLRAARAVERGLAVSPEAVTPERLREAVACARALTPPALNLEGAENTSVILKGLHERAARLG